MTKIDIDKFVASIMKCLWNPHREEAYLCRHWINKALDAQGLKFENWEIVKNQRRIAAEAKEALYTPEVESEDERIRKRIIHALHGDVLDMEETNKAIAWLEKQGEKKLADKIEPKFHEGDWVVDNCGNVWKIEGILNQFYILECVEGGESRPTIEWVDKTFHLWTIQDAKDGDVLAGKIDGDDYILIFKQIKDGWIETYGHYYNAVDRFCVPSQLFCRDYQGILTPATKKQRGLLFQKMKEAGYEWDAEKKKLKKIHVIDDGKAEMDYCFTKMMEGKKVSPTWSEEDERMYKIALSCIETLEDISDGKNMHADVKNWFKSLKQRMGG